MGELKPVRKLVRVFLRIDASVLDGLMSEVAAADRCIETLITCLHTEYIFPSWHVYFYLSVSECSFCLDCTHSQDQLFSQNVGSGGIDWLLWQRWGSNSKYCQTNTVSPEGLTQFSPFTKDHLAKNYQKDENWSTQLQKWMHCSIEVYPKHLETEWY